jgi:hypothetical protein
VRAWRPARDASPVWAAKRDRQPKNGNGKRGGVRESLRWSEGYQRMAEPAARLPGRRLVYVANREADIMDGDGAGLRHTGCAGPGRQAEGQIDWHRARWEIEMYSWIGDLQRVH